jgi:hypothetical protein
MIRVTIDMVPQGDESRARKLHTFLIWNISGMDEIANYNVERVDHEHADLRTRKRVMAHPRENGAMELVWRAVRP